MSETVTIRLSRSLVSMLTDDRIRSFLRQRGLETRTMTCREEGSELVYEGVAIEKNLVTKGNCGGNGA